MEDRFLNDICGAIEHALESECESVDYVSSNAFGEFYIKTIDGKEYDFTFDPFERSGE